MRYGSICSGIEAATVAWHPLGWEPAFFAEIDRFPSAVLAHHYPHVPNAGDFTRIGGAQYGAIELLVGGTPCQSFSVAGLRGGLADDRGNLALEFLRLADRARPRWLVWENVPGVLSSGGGRDFGAILGGLVELGYGFAYRVLDAQHFGVPQRRRRVFVVGYFGDWRRAAAVLFERHSLQGHPAPRREAREGIAPTISARPTGGGGLGTDFDCDGGLIANAVGTKWHSSPEDSRDNDVIAHSLRADGFDASEDGAGRGTPLIAFDSKASGRNGFGVGQMAPTLRAMGHKNTHQNAGGQIAVASFDPRNVTSKANRTRVEYGLPANTLHEQGMAVAFQTSQSGMREVNTHATLDANNGSRRHNGVATASAVRRLTPRECERLQGFPDDYTLIPYRNGKAADGPRYKALGNSMAVPCMAWIGRRIAQADQLSSSQGRS